MLGTSEIVVIGRFVTTCFHRHSVRDTESRVSERGSILRQQTWGSVPDIAGLLPSSSNFDRGSNRYGTWIPGVCRHDGPERIVESLPLRFVTQTLTQKLKHSSSLWYSTFGIRRRHGFF